MEGWIRKNDRFATRQAIHAPAGLLHELEAALRHDSPDPAEPALARSKAAAHKALGALREWSVYATGRHKSLGAPWIAALAHARDAQVPLPELRAAFDSVLYFNYPGAWVMVKSESCRWDDVEQGIASASALIDLSALISKASPWIRSAVSSGEAAGNAGSRFHFLPHWGSWSKQLAVKANKIADRDQWSVIGSSPSERFGRQRAFAAFISSDTPGHSGFFSSTNQSGSDLGGAKLFDTQERASEYFKRGAYGKFQSGFGEYAIVECEIRALSVVRNFGANTDEIGAACSAAERESIEEALRLAEIDTLRARLAQLEAGAPAPLKQAGRL